MTIVHGIWAGGRHVKKAGEPSIERANGLKGGIQAGEVDTS